MGIGVQANLPGGALTQMAFPSPAPLLRSCLKQQGKRAGSGQKWAATRPGALHSSHRRKQRAIQLNGQQSSHSPDGIFQFGQQFFFVFLLLFVCYFTKEFYRPNWAKCWFSVSPAKGGGGWGGPLQLNCPVLNQVGLKFCKGKIFIFPFVPVLETSSTLPRAGRGKRTYIAPLLA